MGVILILGDNKSLRQIQTKTIQITYPKKPFYSKGRTELLIDHLPETTRLTRIRMPVGLFSISSFVITVTDARLTRRTVARHDCPRHRKQTF
jgi:hypothetical protein